MSASHICDLCGFFHHPIPVRSLCSFQEPQEEEDDEDDEEEEEKPLNPPMMVPMADMLNHVSNHNANLEFTPVRTHIHFKYLHSFLFQMLI